MILTNLSTLLVVDEPEAAQPIKTWLEHRQYRVHSAQWSHQLTTLIHELRPELILLGVHPPEHQGLDICRYVKGNTDTFGFLPVVLLLDPGADHLAGLDAGADDFLIRPIKEPEVLVRVSVLLRIKHQHDALWQQNQKLTAELAQRNTALEKALSESRGLAVLKDSIVRNVSHELRTPLVQVKGAVSLLAEDARAASPNGISVLADMATAATAKLESVILSITQLAASLNVKFEPFRVVDAMNHAMRQLNRQWASSAAVDRIKTSLDNIPVVMGDRNGVAQVLQQLIDNAIKFSPNGGPVEITGERRGDIVRVSVRDYGIGIAENQLGQIFQAFYQVDSSTTRPFGGTGVGLAIVRLILDAMNSTIEVESKPGVGSTFSFQLPIAQIDEITHAQEEIERTLRSLERHI